MNHRIPTTSPCCVVGTNGKGITCSFTEFIPFCSELYYFSNYKNFQS